jgi:hypothetical protein
MGTLHENVSTFMIICRSVLLRMRNLSDRSCRENPNTHFMFKFFNRKSYLSLNNVGKYCRDRQATDDNMAHAHCMLGTLGYKHTLIAFPLQKTVARRRLSVASYVHCLSCFKLLRPVKRNSVQNCDFVFKLHNFR